MQQVALGWSLAWHIEDISAEEVVDIRHQVGKNCFNLVKCH